MRIGIIIGSLGYGGAERVTAALSGYWASKNTSVTVFTTMKKPAAEYPLAEGVTRIECYSGRMISTMVSLRRQIKAHPQDIILIMDTPMCVVAVPVLLGLGIPYVVSERSSPGTKAIKWTTKALSHALMNLCDGFVFQTKGAQSYYARRIQRKSVVIPNPLVVESLPAPYEGERDKRVVAVGRLIPAKNYPNLIRAFVAFHQAHPDHVLEIYGDGALKDDLATLVDRLHAQGYVKLMGPSGTVLEEIRTASLYVLSSDIEGLPYALIEAMALGIPCISTDCPSGGPKDLIVDGENGLLIPVSDHKALNHAMERLMADEGLRRKLSSEAIKIRDRLDCVTISEKWTVYFRKIADNRNQRNKSER